MPLRGLSTTVAAVVGLSAVVWLSPVADAQLTDITQTPNRANAGIQKSLEEQIGAGQGDVMTPDCLDLHHPTGSVPRHSSRAPAVPAQVHRRAGGRAARGRRRGRYRDDPGARSGTGR